MRVLALRADQYGCGHYRINLPAANAGVDVQVGEKIPIRTQQMPNGQRVLMEVVADADVVIFQRPMSHHLPAIIETLQHRGVAVVVELDDDLSVLSPMHGAYQHVHPANQPSTNWQHLRTCCRMADLVTVSTPALAKRYAGHGRSVVLPNCVPEALLRIDATRTTDFGWTGGLITHPHDPQEMGLAVKTLVLEGHSFRVVGAAEGLGQALHLDADPPGTGWLDVELYYSAVAKLRVGVAPLQDSAFNRAKSYLKALEYAALGVPYVASPRVEYEKLNQVGLGILASKTKQWERAIRLLLTDSALYAEHRDRGRAQVADYHTIESQGWRWAEAWDQARRNRLKARPYSGVQPGRVGLPAQHV